ALSCSFESAAPPDIYTLSLHDALPISPRQRHRLDLKSLTTTELGPDTPPTTRPLTPAALGTVLSLEQAGRPTARVRRQAERSIRSEEHTSELQSRENLVCRLLLEKKKK